MMSNHELLPLDVTARVAEKIAKMREARLKGEQVELADALALIDGLRDEVPPEAIEEWKWNTADDWPRPKPRAEPRIGLLPLWRPPQHTQKVANDKGLSQDRGSPSDLGSRYLKLWQRPISNRTGCWLRGPKLKWKRQNG